MKNKNYSRFAGSADSTGSARDNAYKNAHNAARNATHSASNAHSATHNAARNAAAEPRELRFKSPEYKVQEKGVFWYAAIAALFAVVIVYGIIDRAWTFIAAFLAGAAAYYYFILREKTRLLDISLTEKSLKIGNHTYPYNQIRYFWIIDKPEIKTLNIRLRKNFMPDIIIFLDEQDAEAVRIFLKNRIQEIEKNEGVISALARLLKI